MSEMNLKTTFAINGLTLDELKAKVDKATTMVKGSADVRLSVIQGDRPWESDQYSLTISGEPLD